MSSPTSKLTMAEACKESSEWKKSVRENLPDCPGGGVLTKMEAATGFEPVNNGFADRCLTAWLCRRNIEILGAGERIRTVDVYLGKVALYR